MSDKKKLTIVYIPFKTKFTKRSTIYVNNISSYLQRLKSRTRNSNVTFIVYYKGRKIGNIFNGMNLSTFK